MYYTYILLCSDKTFYTGSTDNPEERVMKHNSGKGAKYTRGRGPTKIVYLEEFDSRGLALKREAQIKKLSRVEKAKLIKESEK